LSHGRLFAREREEVEGRAGDSAAAASGLGLGLAGGPRRWRRADNQRGRGGDGGVVGVGESAVERAFWSRSWLSVVLLAAASSSSSSSRCVVLCSGRLGFGGPRAASSSRTPQHVRRSPFSPRRRRAVGLFAGRTRDARRSSSDRSRRSPGRSSSRTPAVDAIDGLRRAKRKCYQTPSAKQPAARTGRPPPGVAPPPPHCLLCDRLTWGRVVYEARTCARRCLSHLRRFSFVNGRHA